MPEPLTLRDLTAAPDLTPEDDAWLGRLAASLDVAGHVVHLSDRVRRDDEDPILTRSVDGTWTAGRYIGDLHFEGRELRIEPRLPLDVIGAWLALALNVSVVPNAATRAGAGPIVVQLVDRMWSAAVADAARHGGPRLREVVHDESPFVRGRIAVPATIRHRAAGRPIVASVRTQRGYDNAVGRVLVLADHTLRSLLPTDPDWRPARTDEVLGQIRAVVGTKPALPRARELERIRYSPITRPFASVARFSYEIARGRGPLTSGARDDVDGALIDVAELWELFLLSAARLAFGSGRVEHGTAGSEGGFLLRSTTTPGRNLGRLKPDLIVRDAGGCVVAVIDAKYKRLQSRRDRPSGVDRADLYQLASYLFAHPGASGALAYPASEVDEADADRLGPWHTTDDRVVHFRRFPVTLDEAADALRAATSVDAAGAP